MLINGGGYLSPTTTAGREVRNSRVGESEDLECIDLKKLLEMFIVHENRSVAYQCCSTTLRFILKYRNSEELVEQLNTALAILMTEVIQMNHIKELQVGFLELF